MPRLRPIAHAAALLCVVTYVGARAADTTIDSSVDARMSVNDNAQLTSLPHPTVFILALTPTLSLAQTDESSKLNVDASSTTYEVGRQEDDNHTDLHLGIGYSIDDVKDTYSVKAAFTRDLTIESELASTGVLLARQERKSFTLDPSWTHRFTERLSSDATTEIEIARYAGDYLVTGLSNYHYYAVPAALTYAASEADSISLVLTPSLYSADQIQSENQTAQLDFSWKHQITENMKFSIDLGEFRSRSKIQSSVVVCPGSIDFCELGLLPFVTLHSKSDTVLDGPILQAGFEYQVTEADKASVHAGRDLSPSGSGSLLLVESVDGSVSRSLDPRTELNFGLSDTRTSFIGTSTGFISDYKTVFVDLAIKLAPTSRMEAGLRAIRVRDGPTGPLIHGDEAYLLFHYDWPQKSLVH